jgi:carboxylesterase
MSNAYVVVVHGFTGSPLSLTPQIDAFREAGFHVEVPLLPGHGSSPEDLQTKRYSDWIGAVDDVVAQAVTEGPVVLMGLSMGGTLVCDVLSRRHDLAGAILVNPFVVPPDDGYRQLVAGLIASGNEYAPSIGSDIKREGALETSYDRTPLLAAQSLFEGVAEVESRLGAITTPVLLFSSEVDHVVPVESGERLKAVLGDRCDRRLLANSFHVATLDNDAPYITEESIAFIRTRTIDAVV